MKYRADSRSQNGVASLAYGGRLALFAVAATFAVAGVMANPASACSPAQCPSNNADQQGVAANALPTYPEPAAEEPAAEPVKSKKSAKQATRSQVRRTQLAQRARAGRIAAAHSRDQAEAKAKSAKMLANANAQLVEADAAKPSPADKSATASAAPQEGQPAAVELVAADEFNELDRAAWESNQIPKLMQLKTASEAHAELRDDESRWAQTSTIGKVFVAFGAMLTLGSAIRMFMA